VNGKHLMALPPWKILGIRMVLPRTVSSAYSSFVFLFGQGEEEKREEVFW